MRKFLLLMALFFSLPAFSAEQNFYKVTKIVDGDTFYIDFNNNNFPDMDERVRVNGIDTMETSLNKRLKYQIKDYKLSRNDVLKIGYLAKKFAQKELKNKYVKVVYSAESEIDGYNRKLVSVYYDCNKNGICKNYEEEVLKAGLAIVYPLSNLAEKLYPFEDIEKLKNYAKINNDIELVFLDKEKKEFHDINCPNVECLNYYELVEKSNFGYKQAKCCMRKCR